MRHGPRTLPRLRDARLEHRSYMPLVRAEEAFSGLRHHRGAACGPSPGGRDTLTHPTMGALSYHRPVLGQATGQGPPPASPHPARAATSRPALPRGAHVARVPPRPPPARLHVLPGLPADHDDPRSALRLDPMRDVRAAHSPRVGRTRQRVAGQSSPQGVVRLGPVTRGGRSMSLGGKPLTRHEPKWATGSFAGASRAPDLGLVLALTGRAGQELPRARAPDCPAKRFEFAGQNSHCVDAVHDGST